MIIETFVDGLTDPVMIQNAKLEWQYGMARHVTDTPFYLINQITISEEKLKTFDQGCTHKMIHAFMICDFSWKAVSNMRKRLQPE